MKVLIVNNMAPFVWGGAEELAVHLKRNLIIAGHEAEILRIPFQWEPVEAIPSQMLMVRGFELWNVDHVIALKFPAYLIKHHKKTLWLLHQYRQAYDLFDAGQTNLPPGSKGQELRNLITNADNQAFSEFKNIFTNSEITKNRLLKYNNFNSEILLPPVNDSELFSGGEFGNYIFAGGRVNGMKRQHLLIEALAKANTNVKLIIGGPPDTQDDAIRLQNLVEQLNLHDRVRLDLRFLPREAYAKYINNAAAVAYLPFDEDSLGYVAMEAATAGKPLITTTDSGGILGLVKHLSTGWLADPQADSLTQAINSVFHDKSTSKAYGENAKKLWEGLNINWQKTIEKLLK